MPAYPLRALVLRKTKLGETDVILTLLSEDGRQVRAVAKGLRKPGSRIGGRLEPYSVVDLLLHTGRNLEVISEVRSVTPHAALREDLDRQGAASVVVDLLDKIAVEGQTEPRLFALADTTLGAMESAAPDRLTPLVIAYLLKALAMHGYRPEFETCVVCACEVGETGDFSLPQGGALCPTCGELDPSALRFPAEARAWLQRLLGATMAEITELEMPQDAVYDCFTLIRSFVSYHVPARLKALDYYAGTLSPG
ncbi:MAG TPA: DNA repair protein RecO [Coriobacteriia bacterium]|nr:DNA repair protein RecO [Coriobacteriia bacterium]